MNAAVRSLLGWSLLLAVAALPGLAMPSLPRPAKPCLAAPCRACHAISFQKTTKFQISRNQALHFAWSRAFLRRYLLASQRG